MEHVYHPTLQALTMDTSAGRDGCPVSLVT